MDYVLDDHNFNPTPKQVPHLLLGKGDYSLLNPPHRGTQKIRLQVPDPNDIWGSTPHPEGPLNSLWMSPNSIRMIDKVCTPCRNLLHNHNVEGGITEAVQ